MSKQFEKLEEIFDLPDIDSVLPVDEIPTKEQMMQALQNVTDFEKSLEGIDSADIHDNEMDELAKLAIDAHKDLQDLGMNIEIRHAGEIFSSSSQMLKIAVDAKNNKMEKKLKLMKLQLEKMKLDRSTSDNTRTVDGTAVAIDRNELLKQLRQMNDEDK